MLKVATPIVSVDWLLKNIEDPALLIFDGTIQKVADNQTKVKEPVYIKNAYFFNIKKVFSDIHAPFPNTLISSKIFEEKSRDLGVNKDSCIIVYDQYGYYSCARVWWMFKAMGFDNIAVLDGGLPKWISKSFPVQKTPSVSNLRGDFVAAYKEGLILNHEPVLAAIHDSKTTIVDARGSDRFTGLVAEPRSGLRSGHIPNSKNIPYATILDGTNIKSKEALKRIFKEVKNERLIFSCGSGITACVLALGAEMVGIENKAVYDGSWTEWGSLSELPIEK